MDEQGYRFGVGVLVVASLVIAVILVLFFGAAPDLFSNRYVVTIRFDEAPGVATDTPVRKNGVQIGRVKDIELLVDKDGVDLTLELDSKHKIRAGDQPIIGVGSLITGDAEIEFVTPTPNSLLARFDGASGAPADGMLDESEGLLASAIIKDGDFLSGGRKAPDPLDALMEMQRSLGTTLETIEQAVGQVGTAGNEVGELAREVRGLLGADDGGLQRLRKQTEDTIANFNETLDSIESLFQDPNLRKSLQIVSEQLPVLVEETKGVVTQAKSTLVAFEGVGLETQRTMKNISELTEPFADQGDQILADALRTLNNLDGLLVDLRKVAARVNNADGTVARLLDDDQLYYTFVNTLENVEQLTRRLQPIVEDARIFTDKIGRDPSSAVDLSGAIRGRPRGGVKRMIPNIE